MRDIQTVHKQLIHALSERDAWHGVDAAKYKLASKLVEALQQELAKLKKDEQE